MIVSQSFLKSAIDTTHLAGLVKDYATRAREACSHEMVPVWQVLHQASEAVSLAEVLFSAHYQ